MALELALVLPLAVTLVVGAIQIGLLLLSQTALDAATHVAARRIRTGEIRSSGADAFKSELCPFFNTGLLSCDKLVWNVQSGTSFSALRSSSLSSAPAASVYSPGSAGAVVLVQVFYKQTVVIPFISTAVFGGSVDLSSTTVIRNEDG